MPKNDLARKKGRKSVKTDGDELQELIAEAVAEGLKGLKDDPEDEPGEGGDEIQELVAEALEEAVKRRKARKDDGEEVGEDITADEVMEVVAELLADDGEDPKSDPEDDPEDPEGDPEDPKDDDEKRRKAARRSAQSIKRRSATARPPVQRKYSSLYTPQGGSAARPGEQKKMPAAVQLARAIKCADIFGRGDPDRAAYFARKHYQDDGMAREFKALNATIPSGGGYLIPEIYTNEIIELLYAATVIFELGARKVPLTNGNLNIPKMTSGTRATWGGEARKIAKTQPKYGNIRLSAKRLEAIVPQTRELLMNITFSADEMFARDLMRRMELGLDFGALYGIGGEFQPLGIAANKAVENVDVTSLDTTLSSATGEITPDFPVWLVSKALAKNIDTASCGWAINSMLEGILLNMKTSTGHYIYREEMSQGKLWRFPYRVSNQIPTDSGKTSLFFGNWADLLVGDQLGLETMTTLEGSWVDEAGVTHNAFEENLAATRALMYDDIAVRHDESFIVANNIKVM